mmetsp:Transcript_119679/g.381968  ORF Transcript_119679/g.381968 Transcript_119679/m.381968 type:complete len:610 (-) Transcript_119679:14-1843(-)
MVAFALRRSVFVPLAMVGVAAGQSAASAGDLRGRSAPSRLNDLFDDIGLWRFLPFAVFVIYCCVALVLLLRYRPGTPQRATVNRFFCCWRDLFSGKVCCLYKVIFSPVILIVAAFRIFFCSCSAVYCRRAFWLFFGCCHQYFTDPDFPPEVASMGGVSGDTANEKRGQSEAKVIWVRATDFARSDIRDRPRRPRLHSTDMCLFRGKIEPQDILQGALGDSWLLAAMATLSEHEGAISSLFLTPEVDPRGKYRVKLFDPQESKWKTIVVDDHIPCLIDPAAPDGVRRGTDGIPVAKFARPNGKEAWAMILEKAFAKFCGSYCAIEAGITEWAIVCMTGGNAWRYEVGEHNNIWERSDLTIFGDPEDKRACGFRPTTEQHDSGELFELLRFYHRQGAVLCCGGVKLAGKAQGLVQKHAFSLLQVRTVRRSLHSRQFFRFVQVRNPWGTGEWNGPWSDESPEWEQYPYVRQQLRFERSDDGAYWMQWEDFCEYWSYVGCVDCTTDLNSLRPPLYLESELGGPLKAFFKGCGRFWCLCSGLRHLLMVHEASFEQVAKQDFSRSCGIDQSGLYCRVCEMETIHVDRKGYSRAAADPHEVDVEQYTSGRTTLLNA